MKYSLIRNTIEKISELLLAVFLVASISQPVSSLRAESTPDLEDLKKKYLTLRNTDPEITRRAEWETLARNFVSFSSEHPNEGGAASSLFNAAILYEQMYLRLENRDSLDESLRLLDRIAKRYPKHPLADDALVKRGDISLRDLDDEDEARRCYLEVIDSYPESDQFEAARTKLQAIKKGSPIVQGKDSESSTDSKANNAGKPLVVLDPGHGGEDFGAVGVSGLLEKDVTLAVALELGRMLEDKKVAQVRLTRRTDEFVPLAERTGLANSLNAALFVSLHCNSSPAGKLSGLEVYYLDNTGDQASKTLAERENASLKFEGPQGDLAFMLSDLIQNGKLSESISLGKEIEGGLKENVLSSYGALKSYGVKKAPFYVLVGAHMPAVLVEHLFINNDQDGPLLAEKRFRSELAGGIFHGIQRYLNEHRES